MRLMKKMMGLAALATTLFMTSCLEGGNSASYSQYPGTVEYGSTGVFDSNTYFRGDDGSLILPSATSVFEELVPGDRIVADLAINYDKQPPTGGKYVVADVANITKLRLDKRSDILIFTAESDTAGLVNDPLYYLTFQSLTRTGNRWFFNLALSFYKTDDHKHDFVMWENRIEEKDRQINLNLFHNANGDKNKSKLASTIISYDITEMVNKFKPEERVMLNIRFKGSDGLIKTAYREFLLPKATN